MRPPATSGWRVSIAIRSTAERPSSRFRTAPRKTTSPVFSADRLTIRPLHMNEPERHVRSPLRSILSGVLLLLAPAVAHEASAARIEVIQLERFDNQHNGSIDVDSGVGHNLRQDASIECNVLLSGVIEVGDLER